MNLPAIKQAALERLPDLLSALLPNGTPRGNEYLIGDERGSPGDSCSVSLSGTTAGLWHDHASGHGGDILDLVAVHHGPSVHHAGRWLCTFLGRPELLNGDARPQNDPMELVIRDGERWLKPSRCWTYRDASGAVVGWVLRFDTSSGKTIRPAHIQDGKPKLGGWKKPALKPIYNAHLLAQRPDAPVLVVEGEKTCDAASKLFPDHVCITWMGGAESVHSADLACLNGRTVIVWPDADKPGRRAATYLKSRFPDIRIIPTDDLPDGWDLADEPPAGFDPAGRFHSKPAAPAPPPPEPFRVLGMREDDIYFHSLATGSIFHFAPPALTELNLQLLADDDYWLGCGYTKDGVDVDYRQVAKALIKTGRRQGVFDSDCVRGLGCWLDEGRVIYHAGDRLYVDGVLTPLHSLKSRFIYISRKPIRFNPAVVLTASQGQALCDACDLLPWAGGTHGWTLPAFLFLSHLCGVLTHRPHGWLVGGYGSGKSYTCSNIIDPLIGPAAAKALSGTTAPGIRQKIGCDAVALFGDEFEGKDPQTRDRLRAITELGRQSYVETGWATLHGTASGDGREYRTRSMFFFSSIAASVLENADLSRFVVLEFQKRDDPEAFAALKRGILETIGQPGFADAFIARAVRFAPLVLQAIDVFRRAIQRTCGDSRKADTFGTLAGGRWMLCSDPLPPEAQALDWAGKIQWENEGAGSASDSDPSKAMQVLRMHNHRVQDEDGRYQDMTVDDMLSVWLNNNPTEEGLRRACYNSLMSIGLHPIGDSVDVAVDSQELSRIFKNTPYGDLYPQYLRRPPINGVHSLFKLKSGKPVRAIRVPIV